MFKALFLDKKDNEFNLSINQVAKDDLLKESGNTLVKILYSSLNYKDALAITNTAPVVRKWPMVPGIDGVGEVVSCADNTYKKGDLVVLNGWGCGENHWGCLSQYAYLESKWLIPLPKSFSPKDAMAIGTAGYTAGLCVQKIINHGVKPEDGPILVTGATGGVGSVAITLLSKLGYEVTAATSKAQENSYLTDLGVANLIDAKSLSEQGKSLQKEVWAAAIDVLGSSTLSNVCAQIKYGGIVAACGMAQSLNFPTTVAPFILRGVTLAGVDSVMCRYDDRIKAWSLIEKYFNPESLQYISRTIPLSDCENVANDMINGKIKGRFIVDVNC